MWSGDGQPTAGQGSPALCVLSCSHLPVFLKGVEDLCGGPVVSGGYRSNSWLRKLPHAMGQPSVRPQLLNLCSATREPTAVRSPCTTTKTQRSHKKYKF